MNTRRQLLAMIGAGVLAAPLRSLAQQPPAKIARIGWLLPGSRSAQEGGLQEFRRGMRELGYVEGSTVETEYLYADGQFDRLQIGRASCRERVYVLV